MRRVEDRRFLTGRGRFVDDLAFARLAYGVAVMSPHAHARIVHIDVSQALGATGVLCVLTGRDALAERLGDLPPLNMPEDQGGPKGFRAPRPVLCSDRVRCVGDRVAFVVAETAAQARDAAELIEVDYEPLPAVVNVEDAVRDDAPQLWEACPGNVSYTLRAGDKAATDAAFAKAPHVVRLRLENNRVAANTLEPRCCVGVHDAAAASYTLFTSSQNPHGVRTMLARSVFGIPETRLRVVSPDVGGGFGLKCTAFNEDALVLWVARRCARPVKWVATRSESLMGDNHGRDQVVYGELALDRDGRMLAMRARSFQALGAYTFGSTTAPLMFSLRYIPNVYDVQAIDVSTRAVFTNTAPLSVYRGAGRPEAVYLCERLLDRAAQELGLDRLAIRRRNFIPPRAMPYRTPTGSVYDSGEFAQAFDKTLQLADWDGFDARRAEARSRGRLRGRGISYYIEHAGNMNDRMELRFDPSGAVAIVAGTHSHGQGHATTYAQLVSEWLGVPFEAIRFVQGDTDQVPYGRGTYAARSSLLGSCALREAADAVVAKAKPVAAQLLEAAPADVEFREGSFRVAGTDRNVGMTEVAKAFYRPFGVRLGLEASGAWTADPPNYPNGCHACEVEVDPETGGVQIVRYAVIDDVGRAINPLICEGQVHGGVAQGIGQALLEHALYDRDSGQLISGSFGDYAMPRADDLPELQTGFHDVPCTTNPLGVKGIGEGGAIGAPPAVLEAVLDALRPLGVKHIDMPATPHRVWAAIQRAADA